MRRKRSNGIIFTGRRKDLKAEPTTWFLAGDDTLAHILRLLLVAGRGWWFTDSRKAANGVLVSWRLDGTEKGVKRTPT
jgi:hypothetical protein